MILDDPSHPELVQLRTLYRLDDLLSGFRDQFEALMRLLTWVHASWQHDGNSKPSRPNPLTILAEASLGRRFRCVEYAIVMAAAATAMGMPARVLSLKPRDSATHGHNGAHVVAEVWLPQLEKWVFTDAQFAAVPELRHGPLSALEFREALYVARHELLSKTRIAQSRLLNLYLRWIEPYFYSVNCRIDQRFFVDESEKAPGAVMLVSPHHLLEPIGLRNFLPTSQ